MNNQDIDTFNQQKRAFERSEGLSNTPNYIQSQDLKLDRIEYKLDRILELLEKDNEIR